MQRISIAQSAAILLVGIATMGCSPKKPGPDVAAIIGNDTIRVAQVDSVFADNLLRLSKRSPFWRAPKPKDMLQYRKQAMGTLIVNSILEQEAKAQGIVVDSAVLAREMARVIRKQHKGGREKHLERLARKEITEEQALQNMRHSVLLEAVKDSITRNVATPPESLRSFYDKNPMMFTIREREVSHICLYKKLSFVEKPVRTLKRVDLILKGKDSTLAGENLERERQKVVGEKRKRAQRIRRELGRGANFEKIARNVSEDTLTSKRNGYVKKIRNGYRHPPYSDSAFAIKTGTYSGVTETPYGFFIIRADSDVETTVMSFQDMMVDIRRKFDKKKREMAWRNLIGSKEPTVFMDTTTVPSNPLL